MERVTDFYFLGLQKSLQTVAAAVQLKDTWKESYDKHRQHFKTRDITLPTKFYIFKAIVFSISHVWIDSWTIKKAEHWRINVFKLWCWTRSLRVTCTAMRSNQSILKEINPEYPLEGLMFKLKLQYFGHLCKELTHWKTPWCWERLRTRGEGGNRRWDGWMASPIQWTWVWANSGRQWRTGKPGVLQSMGAAKSQTLLSNWTTF